MSIFAITPRRSEERVSARLAIFSGSSSSASGAGRADRAINPGVDAAAFYRVAGLRPLGCAT